MPVKFVNKSVLLLTAKNDTLKEPSSLGVLFLSDRANGFPGNNPNSRLAISDFTDLVLQELRALQLGPRLVQRLRYLTGLCTESIC